MKILRNEYGRLLVSKIFDSLDFQKHAFSTRDFGNQGLHVGDEIEYVLQNRQKLTDSLGIDSKKIVTAQQVHGDKIARVYSKDTGRGALDYERSIKGCDGLITDEPGVPLFAFYADCVPVFLVDSNNKSIGIIHSGWKGTYLDISGKAVDAFIEEFSSSPINIRAVIGPHICKDCYEVSKDIVTQFEDKGYGDFIEKKRNHLDLGGIIKYQLEKKGVKEIEYDQNCTSCSSELFFSHRKESGKTGRMAGIIMIKETL